MSARTPGELVQSLRATAGGSRRVLRTDERVVTAADFLADVHAVALAFEARGLEPGQRVALIAANVPEWPVVDLAVQLLGGISVPIEPTLPDDLLGFVLRNAAPRWIVHDPGGAGERIRRLVPSLAAPPKILDLGDDLVGWLAEGAPRRAEIPFDRLLDRTGPDDPAALLYTAGSEGEPRGARHSHRSLGDHSRALAAVLRPTPDDVVGIGLSLAHSAARAALRMALETGLELRLDGAPEATLGVVPAPVLCQVATELARGETPAQRWALEVGGRWAEARRTGLVGPFLAAERWLADRLVLRERTRERRLRGLRRLLVIGRVDAGTLEGIEAAGLPVSPTWGVAEAWPVAVAAGPNREVAGGSGQALPGVELRLGDEGRIELRGDGVMDGYWRNEEATALALVDGDGGRPWLRTGDSGRLVDGELVVEGRLAERLRVDGRRIAVERLEAALEADPRIEEAIVPGGERPWAGALIRPAAGVDAEELDEAVEERSRRWPDGWTLERWRPLTAAPGERATSGALRRRRFERAVAAEIDALFS